MAKLLGLLFIASSIFSLFAGAFIDFRFGTNNEITGNLISNVIAQPDIGMNFYDYTQAIIFSYSIISLIMGIIFLVSV